MYKTYLRSDFLGVLRSGKQSGVKNAIFIDFLLHLEKMDDAIRQFSHKPLDEWEADDWRGFFIVLYDNREQLYEIGEQDGADWNYVANPSGGFFGYWWYFKGVTAYPFMPYLQLEQDELCFKINVNDASVRRDARETAYRHIEEAARKLGVNIKRPERMGSGQYMTVARWLGSYRVTTNRCLDWEATLTNLRKAQEVLDLAFASAESM